MPTDRQPSNPLATPPNRLAIGAAGLAIIRRFEIFSAIPTLHRKGSHVIGYSHRLRGDEAELLLAPISRETGEMLMRQDCRLLELYLNATTRVVLAQHQFDALCSLLFDVGIKAFERSPLRACVLQGHHAKVLEEFQRFDDRVFRHSPDGVTRRRRFAEKSLYAGPHA